MKMFWSAPEKTGVATLVLGDFHITLNKDRDLGVCTHGVTRLFVSRHMKLGGMGSMYLTVAVNHTCIDIVEGPEALAVR